MSPSTPPPTSGPAFIEWDSELFSKWMPGTPYGSATKTMTDVQTYRLAEEIIDRILPHLRRAIDQYAEPMNSELRAARQAFIDNRQRKIHDVQHTLKSYFIENP